MMRMLGTMGLLVITAAIGGCGGSTGPGDGGNGSISASVAGSSFSATLATGAVHNGGVLSFAGVQSQGGTTRQLNIAVVNVEGTGTFTFGSGNSHVVIYTEVENSSPQGGKSWTANMLVGSGSVTVTELSASRARGTFQFTLQPGTQNATGTKAVTNGSFNVKLQH